MRVFHAPRVGRGNKDDDVRHVRKPASVLAGDADGSAACPVSEFEGAEDAGRVSRGADTKNDVAVLRSVLDLLEKRAVGRQIPGYAAARRELFTQGDNPESHGSIQAGSLH